MYTNCGNFATNSFDDVNELAGGTLKWATKSPLYYIIYFLKSLEVILQILHLRRDRQGY